jgi:hypothetical protein
VTFSSCLNSAMANPEHLAILKQGVEVWNRWRIDSDPRVVPDLSQVDLKAAYLRKANLSRANLRGANLSAVNLRRADLSNGDLSGTNLTGADLSMAKFINTYLGTATLRGTNLTGADLRGANLNGADLGESDMRGANVNGANLGSADLSNVILGKSSFADANLTGAKGLDSCVHVGPSVIGIDTFFKSGGSLPEGFLRGCGVPEEFISYARERVGKPMLFYSCFISYSTKDQEFSEHLHADLQGKGVRCWFAPHTIQSGKKIHEQIDEAIQVYDRLLLILSEHSMNSEWVRTEIANARQREIREKRQMLFPISLVPYDRIKEWKAFDADTGKDSAREIREYFIPDFSNWKDHHSYQAAFQLLLRDLKAEAHDTRGSK